jgi:hypothetical protein
MSIFCPFSQFSFCFCFLQLVCGKPSWNPSLIRSLFFILLFLSDFFCTNTPPLPHRSMILLFHLDQEEFFPSFLFIYNLYYTSLHLKFIFDKALLSRSSSFILILLYTLILFYFIFFARYVHYLSYPPTPVPFLSSISKKS